MSSLPAAVSVRRMKAADLDRILEIAGELNEAPRWSRNAYLAALGTEAAFPRIALVAEDPGTGSVAGLAVAGLFQPQAELEMIAVTPRLQRLGVARKLFAALTAELLAAQVTEVFLEVRPSNLAALAFYRSLGFAETGRRPRYYHDPVEDAALMSLRFQ